jgi:Holliday junction DNA helicase RuvA
MYAGGTTFYGFISEEERDIFVLLKDKIPGTGAKKSLDYLEKISKSLPDFRRAVMTKNAVLLTSIFGFTKKTAEKIIVSLKDKIHELEIHGKEKWSKLEETTPMSEAVEGLVALGYRESQSRDAVDKILASCPDEMQVEEIIKQALKHL